MIQKMTAAPPVTITAHTGRALADRLPALTEFVYRTTPAPLSRHPGWLSVLRTGLGHKPVALEAVADGTTCGFLPLCLVRSVLFGRFLVSLPYLNSNGVTAGHPDVQSRLVDRAVELAAEWNVKHLELRHESPVTHPALTGAIDTKVNMRLPLPATADEAWKGFDAKVRNQVRKGEKSNLTVAWGGLDLLAPFYDVLSRNMRDLGTPVYGRRLFLAILTAFPHDVEFCVVRTPTGQPVAAALLLHGPGVTEVPTASSLREFNASCANMLMYRHLIDRAIGRGQRMFDFGRSTEEGPTYKFKKQWGAEPNPTTWQFAVRRGTLGDMRPDNPRYQRFIRLWQKLPVRVTQWVGPPIVRGIP
jgi:FemAB-related protein (PEP-CTERM system-associated)